MSMLRTTRSANVPDVNILFHNPTTPKNAAKNGGVSLKLSFLLLFSSVLPIQYVSQSVHFHQELLLWLQYTLS